jgi:hypothetical protein
MEMVSLLSHQFVDLMAQVRLRQVHHNATPESTYHKPFQALAQAFWQASQASFQPQRESGCYWLLGLAVGESVAAGAGVTLKVSRRSFQESPSRT